MSPKRKITFVITDLGTGGAEMMLYKLLCRLDRDRFSAEVISLLDEGPLQERIQGLGIPVKVLGMRRGRPDPRKVLLLSRMLRESRPDLVQTWMYHADLMGGLAAKAAGGLPVVWNIRNGTLEPGASRSMTLWTARLCALISRFLPSKIVCCAHSALEIHRRMGYRGRKMVVIPNGFDVELFRPDPQAARSVRLELGLDESHPVVGLVARFHPQKDFFNFVAAARHVRDRIPEARFVLCGDGVDWDNGELSEWIEAAGLRPFVHLLGRRTDIPRLTASFDLAVSSSACGEAFSNSLGEAMACAVPCVATDVGDAKWIVADTGKVVPPRNSAALGEAVLELLRLNPEERKDLGGRARGRVLENFTLEVVAELYQSLYAELLAMEEPSPVGYSRQTKNI